MMTLPMEPHPLMSSAEVLYQLLTTGQLPSAILTSPPGQRSLTWHLLAQPNLHKQKQVLVHRYLDHGRELGGAD